MGGLGHSLLGCAFLAIGLWHLFNCIKLHIQRPKSYTTLAWFPVPNIRYLEPILVILVSFVFVATELFSGPNSIPSHPNFSPKNLPHIEHSTISISFFISSLFAILLDIRPPPPPQHGLVFFLQAIAFAQQALLLHLHSTDHMGIEWHYHWLLEIIALVSLITTLVAMAWPECFLNAFVRAFSVVFLGVWLIVSGIMLWTREFVPEGCVLKASHVGHDMVTCHDAQALERAKALVNLLFCWCLMGLTVFSMSVYLIMHRLCDSCKKIEYLCLSKHEEQDQERR